MKQDTKIALERCELENDTIEEIFFLMKKINLMIPNLGTKTSSILRK